MDLAMDPTCPQCHGREVTVPAALDEMAARMQALMDVGPLADMSLDQSRCTPETKVRRVLALLRAGALPGGSLLLVGDDDLVSLAVAVAAEVLGVRLAQRIAVVDISPDILGYVEEVSAKHGFGIETYQHDLRLPLPEELCRQFDVAMTDPPYTAEGARVFLSRAVEGLRPGPANSIFFSFGPKSPDELYSVQQEILELGLVTNGYINNFNEYEGSGIIGGSGFLQHLLTTGSTRSSVDGSYQGPMYTRDKRPQQRVFACLSCRARIVVGQGARWQSVAALRADGCPECGGGPFRPRQLVPETKRPDEPRQPEGLGQPDGAQQPTEADEHPAYDVPLDDADDARADDDAPVRAAEGLPTGYRPRELDGYRIRPAEERDLDAIAAFEVEIAQVSFQEHAVDDLPTHRSRLAKAMSRSKVGMFVACQESDDQVVGWVWMSVNRNAMTGNSYVNFRSLAVAPGEDRSLVAEQLISVGLRFAREQRPTEVVGRVYSGNLPMRALYRKFGFESAHMAMRLRLPEGGR
ncbi:GNAT family N-acetyltransferase [Streptacidiphilus sp. PB12-B1b]|uniref:GNAT family N-acetyltransferase n=1 Tax=Streptacidiphilus sp. PB12-B1b TaxID=2705012 RepID=UPI001CDCED0B|nr:GNAT family N-acetyltransferase [Streptacidiphilus sp. PB12-B1b]